MSEQKWYLIDLKDKVLGRAATQIATIIRGKNKPSYSPHTDEGDFVVAINASQVALTGKKADSKVYYWHTGYPGGIKSVDYKDQIEQKPEEVILDAVKGMLPKNSLARNQIKKLKIYSGEEHPHTAQNPEVYSIS